jgi:hypothetical protein
VLENFKILRKSNNQSVIFCPREYLEEILKNIGSRGRPVKPNKLLWVPHLQKQEK